MLHDGRWFRIFLTIFICNKALQLLKRDLEKHAKLIW
jgi:hypothetical protein